MHGGYWQATRHPISCVLFVLPLLLIYEVGLYTFSHPEPNELRNGADVWMRSSLATVGASPVYAAPCILAGVLVGWCLIRRRDRPEDQANVWCGMAIESAVFALILFGLCYLLGYALIHIDHYLASLAPANESHASLAWASTASPPEPAAVQIIGYLGAGIYEETLFRLLLYSGLHLIFRLSEFPRRSIPLLAAIGSALIFAAAHHVGPGADPFHGFLFTFRTLAGLYFATLYEMRGFGIAVGAHAGYDVGLLLHQV